MNPNPDTPMLIRSAIDSDAEAIGRIRVRAWRAAYREYMPAEYLANLDATANLDKLRMSLALPQPPFVATVAQIEEEIVAFSIVGASRHRPAADAVELWALNVEPDCWRMGVGRRLVEAASQHAVLGAASRIELWYIEGNAAASSLYESCGFKRTGEARTTSALTGHPLHELAYAKLL